MNQLQFSSPNSLPMAIDSNMRYQSTPVIMKTLMFINSYNYQKIQNIDSFNCLNFTNSNSTRFNSSRVKESEIKWDQTQKLMFVIVTELTFSSWTILHFKLVLDKKRI